MHTVNFAKKQKNKDKYLKLQRQTKLIIKYLFPPNTLSKNKNMMQNCKFKNQNFNERI